jgi:hypothetical protein
MPNFFSHHDEQALAKRLRAEARAGRPKFSRSLHARLWRAVRQSAASQSAAPTARWPWAEWWLSRWAFAAVAAACLLGASPLVWQMFRDGPAESTYSIETDVAEIGGTANREQGTVGSNPQSPIPNPMTKVAQTPKPATVPADGTADSPSEVEEVTVLVAQVGQQLSDWLDSAQSPEELARLGPSGQSILESLAEHIPLDGPLSLAASGPADSPQAGTPVEEP